jgi:hypothetical protein
MNKSFLCCSRTSWARFSRISSLEQDVSRQTDLQYALLGEFLLHIPCIVQHVITYFMHCEIPLTHSEQSLVIYSHLYCQRQQCFSNLGKCIIWKGTWMHMFPPYFYRRFFKAAMVLSFLAELLMPFFPIVGPTDLLHCRCTYCVFVSSLLLGLTFRIPSVFWL